MTELQKLVKEMQHELDGASTRELAAFFGVSQVPVARWLRGEHDPSLDTINEGIARTARALDFLYQMRAVLIAPPVVVASVKEKS